MDKIEEVNITLDIEAVRAKKETEGLKEELYKINKETEFIKDKLTKYNEEREALILQIKQNDKAKEESISEEVKHHCYKCEKLWENCGKIERRFKNTCDNDSHE